MCKCVQGTLRCIANFEQVVQPVPMHIWGSLPPPPTDIERLLSLVTPILSSRERPQLNLVRLSVQNLTVGSAACHDQYLKSAWTRACVTACTSDWSDWPMQSDLWSFFEDASMYGREVYTLGGSRGPSLAYFVPSLSAMQLFLPARREAAATSAHCYRLSDALSSQVCEHADLGVAAAILAGSIT
jgi:hypothetical protein